MVKVLNREMYYSGNYTREDLIRDNIGYLVETSDMVNPTILNWFIRTKIIKFGE